MQTFGHDLTLIAKQDSRTLDDTAKAFKEAVRIASREDDEEIPVVLTRIVEMRKTLKIDLAKAVRTWRAESNEGSHDDGGHRRCRHPVCQKKVTPGSYYWCSRHIPTPVEVDEDYQHCG